MILPPCVEYEAEWCCGMLLGHEIYHTRYWRICSNIDAACCFWTQHVLEKPATPGITPLSPAGTHCSNVTEKILDYVLQNAAGGFGCEHICHTESL